MSCWSTHVKRYPTCNLKMLAFTHGHEILSASNFKMQATDLLQKNLENARASLEVLVTDLQFLRDQVTITQVLQAQVDMDQTQQLSKLLNKIVLSYSLLLKLNSLH
ncbi:hypothetical protein CsSME_00039182 [Camellia sinensis var. sinensis]